MGSADSTSKTNFVTGDTERQPALAATLDGSPVTVFVQDRELRYTWICNPTVGLTPEEIVGRTDEELFTPDEAATLRAIKLDVLTTGRRRRNEVRIQGEGHPRYYDLTVEAQCDGKGRPLGITGTAIDITQRHATESRQRILNQVSDTLRTLEDPYELMRAAANLVRRHLHVRHVVFGEITSGAQKLLLTHPHLADPEPMDTSRFGSFIVDTLRRGRPTVIHHVKQHPHLEPAVIELLRELKAAAIVAVPLLKGGQLVAVLIAYDPQPRIWDKHDVALLGDVAQRTREAVERARAERALRDSEARFRQLSELTSDYAFSYRPADDGNHVVEWKSGAFERITGHPNDLIRTAADWSKLVHRDDLPALQQFTNALLANKPQSVELRVVTLTGEIRWLTLDAQPIWDEGQQKVGRVIGAARDITLRKQAEQERQRLLDRLEAERGLIEAVIEQMPVAVIVAEAPSGKLLFANAQVYQITGYARPDKPDSTWADAKLQACHVNGTPMPIDQWPLTRALRDNKTVEAMEFLCYHAQRDQWVTLRCSAAPVHDASGRLVAAVSIFSDITEEKRAETATRLLARAGRILASSLDYETTLRSVTRLSVPDLADWCQLDLVTSQGELKTLAAVHADEPRTKLVEDLAKRYPISPNASWGPWAVMRSGQAEWSQSISDEMLVEIAHDAEHLAGLRDAGLRSYISVPLKGRDQVLGVLTFVTDRFGFGRQYAQSDVDLAKELAYRATMVIEKAMLYRDAQRELAERRAAERELQSLNETLEQRVAERTAEAEHRATQLRELAAELTQAEQRERRQLAQTLHDHLQQLLVAAKLRLHAIISQFNDQTVVQAMRQIDELLTQSVDASRSLTIELSPPILHDAGLAAALDWLGRWMRDKHGLHVTVRADPHANPATEDLRVFLFNAARELLFNVVKHAVTRRATVELSLDEQRWVHLVVSDEGVGFDPTHAPKDRSGFGLFSIQQRLDVLGGKTFLHSRPGEGTRIELRVPDDAPPD